MGSQPRATVIHITKDSVQAAATLPLSAFAFYMKVGYGDYETTAALLCCSKRQISKMVKAGQLKVVIGPGRQPFIPLMQLAEYFDVQGMLDRAPMIEGLQKLNDELVQRLEMMKVRKCRQRGRLSKPFIASLKTPTAAEAEEIMRRYD